MNLKAFKQGLRDGAPIGIGYFAVAFSLGIAMKNANMTPFQGFLMSLFNIASAGEYAGIRVILSNASYIQIILVTIIANARYLLMSAALSQKFSSQTNIFHRLSVGFQITDELFGLAIGQKGYLNPFYYYGAGFISVLPWAIGTAVGVFAGEMLPQDIVSALNISLFGMFIAIIIPAGKENKTIMNLIIISFLASFILDYIPLLSSIDEGMKIIFLTIVIACAAAYIHPVKGEDDNHA